MDQMTVTHASALVSFICTTRNASRTLESTIQSICKQEYEKWELIIVDDGSSDSTVQMLRCYSMQDKRIRLMETAGVGRGRALNMALSAAAGVYVANNDADDISHPKRILRQVAALSHNKGYTLLCTNVELIVGNQIPRWEDGASTISKVTDITNKLMLTNPIVHSSVLMHTDTIRKIGGYATDRNMQLDYELWIRIAAAGGRVGLLHETLVAKREHSYQSYGGRRRIRYLMSTAQLQIHAIKELSGNKILFLMIFLRVLWGILPAPIRHKVRHLGRRKL